MRDHRFALLSGQPDAGSSSAGRRLRCGALTAGVAAAAMAAAMTPADARMSWPSEYSQTNNRATEATKKERRTARRRAARQQVAGKEVAKPIAPLLVAISIDKQQLKLYDRNGLFAESPVSTGTRSHPTPKGVFSIIQRSKHHRSNIYSGAPMPYMQRITWSGVAMHAGVLPGYPASHGCIRMPMSFATRMWGWTKMGARVIISPGELSPADFAHPRLIARKPDPVVLAAVSEAKDVALPPKSDQPPSPGQMADASGGVPQSAPDTNVPSPAPEAVGETLKDAFRDDVKNNKDQARSSEDSKTVGDASTPIIKAEPAKKAEAEPAKEPGKDTGKDSAKPAPKRSGHVAAYISGKNSKLYVRQDFEPLFDVPVTIAAADRPLGTHIFTARTDIGDANALSWTVVSMPAAVRRESATPQKRKKETPEAVIVSVPPSSPAEAFDRITISDEAMQKIAAAIATGGSLVISDQGLGDETGLGTDFIVPLR